MGIRTVAEYVEGAETVQALTALGGVDYAQGNHFAAPRPLAELCRRLTGQPSTG